MPTITIEFDSEGMRDDIESLIETAFNDEEYYFSWNEGRKAITVVKEED